MYEIIIQGGCSKNFPVPPNSKVHIFKKIERKSWTL